MRERQPAPERLERTRGTLAGALEVLLLAGWTAEQINAEVAAVIEAHERELCTCSLLLEARGGLPCPVHGWPK